MIDYTQAGAELAAKLANAEGGRGVWTSVHFTADGIDCGSRAFAKFCAQVLEERAAAPGVRTPASDQAAVDTLEGQYNILGAAGDRIVMALSEQIAANHALRRQIAGLIECEAVILGVTKELDEAGTTLIAERDERIAQLEAEATQALTLLGAICIAPGSQDALRDALHILTRLMPANVDPLVAALTEMLVRRGIAPDPDVMLDEAAFVRARLSEAELGKAQP